MNVYRVETVVDQDGTLVLKGLPFHVGESVEVIILERSPKSGGKGHYPLRGKPIRYDDPTSPVAQEDWDVLP